MSSNETVQPRMTAAQAHEICQMAGQLVGRHGPEALSVADYFVAEQRHLGDPRRAWAWQAVRAVAEDLLNGHRIEAHPALH